MQRKSEKPRLTIFYVLVLTMGTIGAFFFSSPALADETAPNSVAPPLQSGTIFTAIVGTGNWNDPTTWDQNAVPTATDEVIIPNGRVNIPSGLSVTRDAPTTINLNGQLANEGGTFSNNDTLTNSGTLGNIGGTFINDGTLNSDGILASNGAFSNNGTITNTGFLEVSGNTLTNNGILTNSGTLNIIMGGSIDNAGTLENACNGSIIGSNPTGNPVQQETPCTFTSITNGDWDNASTWDLSRTPTNLDTVIIANGTTVTIPNGLNVTRDAATTVESGGTLLLGCDATISGGVTGPGTITRNCGLTVALDDASDSGNIVQFQENTTTYNLQDPGNPQFNLPEDSGSGAFTFGITPPGGLTVTAINITNDTDGGSTTDVPGASFTVDLDDGEFITATVTVSPPTITVIETDGSTELVEGGGSDNFRLEFSIPTSATLDIVVDLSNQCFHTGLAPGEALRYAFPIGQNNVTFFPSAVDDLLVESSQSCTIDISVENSSDPNYPDGLIATINAPITDNDTPAGSGSLIIDPTRLLVAEDEPGSNSFTVALGQAPVSGELITVTFSYDSGQLILSQDNVQFNSLNFNQPMTINVDAVADGVSEEILPYDITVMTSSNLGNTALNGLQGIVTATIFDSADLIIVFVPNIGEVTLFTSNIVPVYESANGGVLRDETTTAEVFLPRDADGNGFDTYLITNYSIGSDGSVWLGLWLGSRNWGWIQYDSDIMQMSGAIWEMMYTAQN